MMLRQTSSRSARQQRAAGFSDTPPAEAGDLFEALRAWRAAEAKQQAIPPYVIFHDSVLREIVAARPASLEELGQIKGVGTSKQQRYGAAVLTVLRPCA